MKKIKYLLFFFIFIPTIVLADTGPKPSINITLKNIENSDYLIDLLSDFTNKENLISEIVSYYEDYKDREIYKYHEDNWYATALRNFLLWGSIEGNDTHKHSFTYFGVPDEFKVIIELPDGTIKVSDKIKKTEFNFDVTIDVNDMKVLDVVTEKNKNDIFQFLVVLALTILIETSFAILFKTGKYYIIALVNLLTNIGLQLLMIKVSSSLTCFIVSEIGIIIIEGFIYLQALKIDSKKIVLYTILANLITASLTFVL